MKRLAPSKPKRFVALLAAGVVGLTTFVLSGTVGIPLAQAAACGSVGDWFDNATENPVSYGSPLHGADVTIIAHSDTVCSSYSTAVGGAFLALQSNPTGGVIKVGFRYSAQQGCNEWYTETKENPTAPDAFYVYAGHCIPNNSQHVLYVNWDPIRNDFYMRVDSTVLLATGWGNNVPADGGRWQNSILRIGGEVNYLTSNMPGNASNATTMTNMHYSYDWNDSFQNVALSGILMNPGPNSNPSKWGQVKIDDGNWGFYTTVAQ